jgi:uncharacterized protein (DUF697 family)
MLTSVLYDLPNATDTLTSIGAYSLPVFNELMPLAWLLVGVVVGAIVVSLVVNGITNSLAGIVQKLFPHD